MPLFKKGRKKPSAQEDNLNVYQFNDYSEYKEAQVQGNLESLDNVWVSEDNIRLLSEYIKKNVPNPKFGICHGTRGGKEQEWFRKYLGIEVIGTEISFTAAQFPHTIEWDFHKVKDEWIDNVDFIYSNSFDHSYDPKMCLDAWMKCIKKDGVCILEWTKAHIKSTKRDPFGGKKRNYKKLIQEKYQIKDIISGKKSGLRKKIKSLP